MMVQVMNLNVRFKSETTTTCDWRIGPGVKDANIVLISMMKLRFLGLEYVTGAVAGTNISGENLLFVGHLINKCHICLNSNYQCVLLLREQQ